MRDDVRLDEYDKAEWREVAQALRPDWTEDQFDEMWDDFCAMKRAKSMN